MLFESNTETERISVMRGSRQVLVEVVLFQLWGRGHPQDDASLNFFLEFKDFLQGLSNEVLNFFLLQVFQKKLGINRNQSCILCGY